MRRSRRYHGVRAALAGIVAAAGVAILSAPADGTAAVAADPPALTALVGETLDRPSPVLGADGRLHLAYELRLVNQSNLLQTIDSIEVLDARSGAVLQSLSGDALASVFLINGDAGGPDGVPPGGQEPANTLGPSHSGYVFLDVTLPEGARVPRALVHRFSITQQVRAAEGDDHHGAPPPPDVAPAVSFTGVPVRVDRARAVVVAPPLRGPRWLVGNGCCASITAHRGAVLSIDGTVHVAERFAIDFVQLHADGRVYTGPIDELSSYPAFGAKVHSVAAGVVAATRDGEPEQTPGTLPAGQTVESAGGNYVVVDIGKGRFAFYAHLQTRSLRVARGDRVRRGQVLGLLGNTGNSDEPHLHFHVMDGPSPLLSNGIPFAFTAFAGQGVATDLTPLFAGDPVPIDRDALAGPHRDAMPLENQVVTFP